MPPLTTNYLPCLSDEFTPVRDTQGRLLGAVPRVPDTASAVPSASGQPFELRIAAQVCVCVDLSTQSPSALAGFIPYDNANIDLAVPATTDNTDIGQPA